MSYAELGGTCKAASEKLAAENPGLRVVRGYYYCPMWGKRDHWWCQDAAGAIVDPTVSQFPTKGVGAEYEEFDGFYSCEECGKAVKEEDSIPVGCYAFCSGRCAMRCLGI